ncbi:hypothetical protein B0H21DRAFT_851760 [Amylocystis lapponica]|nr:hypothetical protein B0H21DRAFT_851760 [Amylocystis lapponica]
MDLGLAYEAVEQGTQDDPMSVPGETKANDTDDAYLNNVDDELYQNLCDDFKANFRWILQDDSVFNRRFFFGRVYTEAPDPVLNLNGCGIISLPLGAHLKKAIKLCAQQSPPPRGSRRPVNGLWKLGAQEVSISNPAWKFWMENIIQSVCADLGVDYVAFRPRWELRELQLLEDSDTVRYPDVPVTNDVFATLVVVLPSGFVGGATTVMAWFTGVPYTLERVFNGCRFSLVFDLFHSTMLSPAPSVPADIIKELRRVLVSWKAAERAGAQNKIVYLFNNIYAHRDLRGGSLKGSDAQIAAVLADLAERYDFHLGLARVVCYACGDAGYCESGYDDLNMINISEPQISLKDFTDLDGNLFRKELEFDCEHEAITKDLGSLLVQGEPEWEVFDFPHDTYSVTGTLHRQWSRAALVLWPERCNLLVIYGTGSDGLEAACEKIRTTDSSEPTPQDAALITHILRYARKPDYATVLSSLCSAACAWKNLDVWIRAVKACDACRNLASLGEGNIRKIILSFNFEAVQPILEEAILRDPSGIARLQWLLAFQEWVFGQSGVQLSRDTLDWLVQQQLRVEEADEKDNLTSRTVAINHGSPPSLDSIITQIKDLVNPWNLCEMADSYHKHRMKFTSLRLARQIVRDLIQSATVSADFYGPVGSTVPPALRSPDNPYPAQLYRARLFVTTCLSTVNADLLPGIFRKLTNMDGASHEVMGLRASEILMPLLLSLADVVYARPADRPFPSLSQPSSIVVSLRLKSLRYDPKTITSQSISSVLQAARLGGRFHIEVLAMATKFKTIRGHPDRLRVAFEEIHRYKQKLPRDEVAAAQTAINKLVMEYARQVSLTFSEEPNRSGPATTLFTIIADAFDCFLRMDVSGACYDMLPSGYDKDMCYNDILVPLIPTLHTLARKYGRPITSSPFNFLFSLIMRWWTNKTLGADFDDASRNIKKILEWACSCATCVSVRTFLLAQPHRSQTWPCIGANMCRHVENFLIQHLELTATWHIERTPAGAQGLTITKARSFCNLDRWHSDQSKGLFLLNSISRDTDELKKIFAWRYDYFQSKLRFSTMDISTSTTSDAGTDVTHPAEAN